MVIWFERGAPGVASPIISMPAGLRSIESLFMHRLPRQGPMPRRVVCLISSNDMYFLSPMTAIISSSFTSSQWQTYSFASMVAAGVKVKGSG